MASKAFYRSKKGSHVFPMTDILGRAQRALERGVPIGRGHALEIKQGPGLPSLLPNWYHHDVTVSIRDAMTAYPPMPVPRCMVNRALEEQQSTKPYKEFPIERLLDKFLKRHPEVVWKVPNKSSQDWAPTRFCRRQWDLMQDSSKKHRLTEEQAYQQVVLEGGGGGDWHGVELEHNQLKRVLKKTAAFTENKFSQEGMLDGYSLVREYMRLKEADDAKQSASASSTKFLVEAEQALQDKEEKRRQFDYKILAKMRNVSLGLESQQPSWVEATLDIKGTRYEQYNLKVKIINQLFAEREARELAEENGEEYVPSSSSVLSPSSSSFSSGAYEDDDEEDDEQQQQQQLEVFVGNLPSDATEADILAHFTSSAGVTPKRVALVMDPVTKQCKGFAFALFESDEDLSQALKTNTFQLRGKLVKMRLSVPK